METQRTILHELEEECGEEGREDILTEGGAGIDGDAPDVYSCIMESGGGGKDDQKLFKAAEMLFRTCKSTLDNYYSVKDDINHHKQPGEDGQPREDGSQLLDSNEVKWLEDMQNLDQIVDFAHIWARHIEVCMVTGEHPRGPDAEDLDERGEMAIDSLQKSADMACGTGSWGKARKMHVKALRTLATGSETQDG
ncbi:hypothetical protein MAPG_00031 [Magnaporthiopsis poae ATCC 64411]|uniref:Uncharacterized protein n=1 Tax=Magnaporthiopsis poae (strain ATCC 64411 / 73-15) TaxID=644358 RepID=A0A0C4DJX2_MAGP6|nr:hypothetical protein MAPG_00031 [Magnaporthiopsis poae ATCC 64411]